MKIVFKKHKENSNKTIQDLTELNFDRFSKALVKLDILKEGLSDPQKVCLNFPSFEAKVKQCDILDTLSEQESLSITSNLFTYQNIKLSYIYSSFNKILGEDMTLYSIEEFNLLLNILCSILSNFNDDLFQYDLNDSDLFTGDKNQIKILNFNDGKNDYKNISQKYQKKITDLYNIIDSFDYETKNKNLIIILYYMCLFGDISYSNLNIECLNKNINIYNSIICNDYKIFLLIHFNIVILTNFITKKSSVENFFNKNNFKNKIVNNSNKNTYDSANENDYIFPTYYYPSLYNKNDIMRDIKKFSIITVQLVLKLYLIPFLLAFMEIKINIHLVSFENLKFINNYLTFNYKITEEDEYNGNDKILIPPILFSDLITNSHKIKVNKFILSFYNINSEENLDFYLRSFKKLIYDSKYFVGICSENNLNNMTYTNIDLYNDYNILLFLIKFILKMKKEKKLKNKNNSKSKIFHFSFEHKSFYIRLNKDTVKNNNSNNTKDNKNIVEEDDKSKKRNISLELSQIKYNENDFLNYISKNENLHEFYSQIKLIISQFSNFKKYKAQIRISKNQFENFELSFYMHLICLMIVNYIKDNNNIRKSNISIYESEYINNQFTLIINSSIIQKDRQANFNKYLSVFKSTDLMILNIFYSKYYKCFTNVLIHDEVNNTYPFIPRILLRNFNGNYLIIINKTDQLLDIIIYLDNNPNDIKFYSNIFELIRNLRLNDLFKDFIDKITLVLRKNNFNNSFNLKANPSENINNYFLEGISSIFIIGEENKKIDFYYNLNEEKIILYNIYEEKINFYYDCLLRNINEFLPIIQYILEKKITNISSFYIIFKKKIFIFKKNNFIIKKISNKSTYDVFNTNIFSSEYSYPLFILYNNGKVHNIDLSIENLIKIYKHNFKENINEDMKKNSNILESSINKFQKENTNDIKSTISSLLNIYGKMFTPFIFSQKYYKYFNDLLSFSKTNEKIFEQIVIFPIPLNEIYLNVHDTVLCKSFTDKIIIYKFNKTNNDKIFFNNDIGRLFSSSKLMRIINYFDLSSKKDHYDFDKYKMTIHIDQFILIILYVFKHKYKHKNNNKKAIIKKIIQFLYDDKENEKDSKEKLMIENNKNIAEIYTQNYNVLEEEVNKYKTIFKQKKHKNLHQNSKSNLEEEVNNNNENGHKRKDSKKNKRIISKQCIIY